MGITIIPPPGTPQGGGSLTTAGANVYVASAGTITQDTSFTRSAAGRYTLYDATPTTGVTTLTVRAGAGQSGTNLLEVKDSSGTNLSYFSGIGAAFIASGIYLDAGGTWSMASTAMNQRSDTHILWASTTNATASKDVGLIRDAAGRLRVSNGSTGLGQIMIASSTPASASATGAAGTLTWDASFLYICTSANVWRRVAHATW